MCMIFQGSPSYSQLLERLLAAWCNICHSNTLLSAAQILSALDPPRLSRRLYRVQRHHAKVDNALLKQ